MEATYVDYDSGRRGFTLCWTTRANRLAGVARRFVFMELGITLTTGALRPFLREEWQKLGGGGGGGLIGRQEQCIDAGAQRGPTKGLFVDREVVAIDPGRHRRGRPSQGS